MKLSLTILCSASMAPTASAFQSHLSLPSFQVKKLSSSEIRMGDDDIIIDAPEPVQGIKGINYDNQGSKGKQLSDPMNLYSSNSEERKEGRIQSDDESDVVPNKAIYDPLRIYPSDSEERKSGQIKASEPDLKVTKAVVDPMNIYSSGESIDADAVMSEALPFLTRPLVLDGSMVGDAGFDPLGFAQTKEDLMNYREAEIKHARLAMLAAAGWPLSEVFDKKIALALHMSPLLDATDRAPSILNGGLEKVNPFYWMAVLAGAAAIDVYGITKAKSGDEAYFPGNLGFDPLGVYPKTEEGQRRMQLAEIKNGRLAMISIFGFAIQEFVSKAGVIDETPFFFQPFSETIKIAANQGYVH